MRVTMWVGAQYPMAIDKLLLEVPVDDGQLQAVESRIKGLIDNSELVRDTTKRTFFKRAAVLKLKNGAKVVFHTTPNNPGKGANMQVVLNPHYLSNAETQALIDVWKKLFPHVPQEVAASMLARRIDSCIDVPYTTRLSDLPVVSA